LEASGRHIFRKNLPALTAPFSYKFLETIRCYSARLSPNDFIYEVEISDPAAPRHKDDFNSRRTLPGRQENIAEIALNIGNILSRPMSRRECANSAAVALDENACVSGRAKLPERIPLRDKRLDFSPAASRYFPWGSMLNPRGCVSVEYVPARVRLSSSPLISKPVIVLEVRSLAYRKRPKWREDHCGDQLPDVNARPGIRCYTLPQC
jgi:hypothetical protein